MVHKHLSRCVGLCTVFIFVLGIGLLFINMMADESQVSMDYNRNLFQSGYLSRTIGTAESDQSTDHDGIKEKCHQRIVFVKTHKTAGSTVAAIIQRYGLDRNLAIVTPKRRNYNRFTGFEQFNRNFVYRYTELIHQRGSFDILATHAIYNRLEMKAVVPNPVFVTVLRDPVQQFLSAFSYYNYTGQMGVLNDAKDPVETFLRNPDEYTGMFGYGRHQTRNGQLYDLGINAEGGIKNAVLKNEIKRLDKEFDLVMITEYFDESLVLLKKSLCWRFKDILYIPLRVNPVKNDVKFYQIDSETKSNIQSWNQADVELYQYFNETLWKNIDTYGPEFWTDLQTFRGLLSRLWKHCDYIRTVPENGEFVSDRDHAFLECTEYFRLDDDNIRLARERLRSRLDNRCRTNCHH